MDYEWMWNKLKESVGNELKNLTDENTNFDYAIILRMSTAKIVQQSMNKIEEMSKSIEEKNNDQ